MKRGESRPITVRWTYGNGVSGYSIHVTRDDAIEKVEQLRLVAELRESTVAGTITDRFLSTVEEF